MSDMADCVVIRAYLTIKQAEELKRLADAAGVERSEMAARAISEYLVRQELKED